MGHKRWFSLDVNYLANPKVLSAGRDGRDLHLASMCWQGMAELDGSLPDYALGHIGALAGLPHQLVSDAVERVVDAGLWVPNGVGFVLKDWVEMQGTRAEHEAAAAKKAERMRAYRRSKRDEP